jgi:phosphoglycerate kinase
MPADSSSNLERHEGPAIVMDYNDHKQTASCGSSREAKEYRAAQKELIDQRKFKEALQMDIDDIHDKFGDKYDEAISQMLEHVDRLEKIGKI